MMNETKRLCAIEIAKSFGMYDPANHSARTSEVCDRIYRLLDKALPESVPMMQAKAFHSPTCCEAREMCSCLEYLRDEEADSVLVLWDNPVPDTKESQCAVECSGAWTSWQEQRFSGETLLLALKKAVAAKVAVREASEALSKQQQQKGGL